MTVITNTSNRSEEEEYLKTNAIVLEKILKDYVEPRKDEIVIGGIPKLGEVLNEAVNEAIQDENFISWAYGKVDSGAIKLYTKVPESMANAIEKIKQELKQT